jgi:hypothetical protein
MSFTEQLDSGMNTELSITNESKSFLLTSCKWAKFLAIVGFVFLGLFVIVAFLIGFAGFPMDDMPASGFGEMQYVMMFMYLFIALLYFFPTLYLYRFSTFVKQGIENNSTDLMTSGFENLKSCFKFMGVTMAVFIGFYAILLAFGGIAMLAS